VTAECCPISVMPSPTCYTEHKKRPLILFFGFFSSRYLLHITGRNVDPRVYKNGMPTGVKLSMLDGFYDRKVLSRYTREFRGGLYGYEKFQDY